jgi:hypothetical protein
VGQGGTVKIVYVYADFPGEGACSDWLCRFPAAALDKAGYDVGLMHATSFVKSPPKADIIVVERLLWGGADSVIFDAMPDGPTKAGLSHFAGMRVLDAIELCQDRGAKVIALFDDHFEAYPSTHPRFRERWLNGTNDGISFGFIPIEDFRRGLGIADAAMVPSVFLAEHYGKYAKRMYRIHNRPALQLYPLAQNSQEPHQFTLGWAGTSQHESSWRDSPVLEALKELRDRITLVGHFPNEIGPMLDDAGITYRHGGWVDYNEFPMVVATYDIGICPLAGEYDKGRSWIKWLECSLMGKPVVAQDHAGVYSECRGGFIAQTVDDWVLSILALMDEELYTEKSREGMAWGWQQGWDSNLSELLSIFTEVLDD